MTNTKLGQGLVKGMQEAVIIELQSELQNVYKTVDELKIQLVEQIKAGSQLREQCEKLAEALEAYNWDETYTPTASLALDEFNKWKNGGSK